jgi:hydrogenase maturation protease
MEGRAGDVVVIGCGNLLRGDDAVGPTLIRLLWDQGLPGSGVVLVDGGTAGMDVSFKMRGARKVVIVDASATGSVPGTIFRVPAAELEDLPALEGLHSHAFRWDHALAFARWLLKDEYPDDITVFLVEAASVDFGAPMTPAVAAAMEVVAGKVRAMWEDDLARR